MRRRSGQLFAPMLGAVLLAVGVGVVIGLRRERAGTPFVLRDESGATVAAALKREPISASVVSKGQPTATAPGEQRSAIKCRIGLASCRKWVALQERKGRLLVHGAQR